MREYYTIMVPENASGSEMKNLTEKLNAGFYVDNYITVGRSTLMILQKREDRTERSAAVPSGLYELTRSSDQPVPF